MSYQVESILRTIEKGDPKSLVEGVYELERMGQSDREILPHILTALVRWAVVIVLGLISRREDRGVIEVLMSALRDENQSIRVRAAESLIELGVTDGIPTLIEALGSNEVMIGHPPEMVSDCANQILERVYYQNFGFDNNLDQPTKRRIMNEWKLWRNKHKENIPVELHAQV
ncbi:MAG: hypothetical protein FD167_2112 [bacterium]|nr:MAG: hypothetical protein FD167_2112 [bacterium]